jgi:glycosyltransferase involved in cell wall biosynthesis
MAKMTIGLNNYIAVRGVSGSGVGGSAIAAALARGGHNTQPLSPTGYRLGSPARNLARMAYWDAMGAARAACKTGSDLMINLANSGLSHSIPMVTVMHDTMVLDHPSYFHPVYRKYAQATFGPTARRSEIVVAPSVHSSKQVLRRWPKCDVRVVPWSVEVEVQKPRSLPTTLNILSIASSDRHKRLPMLAETVQRLRADTGLDFRITYVAKPGNDHQQLEGVVRGLNAEHGRDWITFITDGIETHKLLDLLDDSFCLAATAIDEGFCLPILEASARALPVVHCDRGAMSEILPLADKFASKLRTLNLDAESIYLQIMSLLDTQTWQAQSQLGLTRAAMFSVANFEKSWLEIVDEAGR